MKKLLLAGVLVLGACDDGCDTDPCFGETGSTDGTDDTDTDTAAGPTAPVLTMATDRVVLQQGATTAVAYTVDDGGAEVELTTDALPEGCVTVTVSDTELALTASAELLGDCMVRLVATNSAGVDVVELPAVIDTDWGGTVVQWGTEDSEYPRAMWVDPKGGVHVGVTFGEDTEPVMLSVTPRGTFDEAVFLGSGFVYATEMTGEDDTVYVGVSDGSDRAALVPVRGGKAGTPFPLAASGQHFPVGTGTTSEGVWMATDTDNEDGVGGLALGRYSLDGSVATITSWFPSTDRGINLYGAVSYGPDLVGWGLAYDTEGIFDEQTGEAWGSFVAHLDPTGTPVTAFGVGTGNVQIAEVAAAPDLRLVLGGRARNDGMIAGNGPGVGRDEPFVQLVEPNGTVVWTRYWTTEDDIRVSRVLVDRDRVFVLMSKRVPGSFISDMAVLDMDDGSIVWQDTFGTTSAVPWSASKHGNAVVIAGATFDALSGENQGKADVFVARFGWDGSAR